MFRLCILFLWVIVFACQNVCAAQKYTPGQPIGAGFDRFAKTFLENHCLDCHGPDSPEAGLSLDSLGPVDETNAATWRSIWAQVALKAMPPVDMDQPEVIERLRLTDGVVAELTRVMEGKGGFHAHEDPTKGNFVDHDLLFGSLPEGIKLVPTSSPSRIWRVTREEHITRLNELINLEPEFDPRKRGLRTRGDVVPTNHGGELKLYFGTDRIINWSGGTVAYAGSVKSVPAVLANSRAHGLKNYAHFQSVNSSEATQILSLADDILRYMAYGPLSIAEPEQISDDPDTIHALALRYGGDIRGLPIALIYSTKIRRPLTPVHDLMAQDGVDEESLRAAIVFLFEALTFRPPSEDEITEYFTIAEQSVERLGKEDGAILGLSSIFLDPDALFRSELASAKKADAHGRVMLQDWELGLAVNHALSYIKPDEELKSAIGAGRMRTREDVRREVTRMLGDETIRKPRVLQFFRDYFDYDLGGYICKDSKALQATGLGKKSDQHYQRMFDATASTDRLIEMVLQKDRDVLKQLLTTDRAVVTRSDVSYFGRKKSVAEMKTPEVVDTEALEEEHQAALKGRDAANEELVALQKYLKENRSERKAREIELMAKSLAFNRAKRRVNRAVTQKKDAREPKRIARAELEGPPIFARVSRRSFGKSSMKPGRQLASVPEGERLGLLTHPAWLVSHSDAMDNHAIRRGRWIQERLLGGGIPDVPITVDAMLPEDPEQTLRERMRVTREDYCWSCHQKMDPLGLPFEMYNHAGIYRTTELGKRVDTRGEIINSGVQGLDGKVADAIELINRIAESERAEQVFVRHAFRFWMGRNETLHDASVLQSAYRAYKKSGGSMNALLVSLLTSDAFLYRRAPRQGL